jgi:hypothetical protein
MKFTALLIGLLLGAFGVVPAVSQTAETQSPAEKIGPEAVWGPGMSIMQDIRQQCSAAGQQFGECFVNGMQKAGASPQAVAFARLTDNTGYVRDFRQIGPVDVAYVNFPYRANENQGAYLVNGSPQMIDIDDQSLLAKDALAKNAAYARLVKKYTDVTIWPGNRNGTDYPSVKQLPQGGRRFTVNYLLRNGCHACAVIGNARFGFVFDRTGKFLGTKLVGVKPKTKGKQSTSAN